MKVYVAGPYTQGDIEANVLRAIEAADKLLAAGHVPFVPHLSHFWDMASPKSYEQWLTYCIHWVKACDAVVRLPGESPGSDREIAVATLKGLPVFYGVDDFLAKAHRL